MAMNSSLGSRAVISFFGLTCVALSITIIVLIAEELYPGSGYYSVYYPSINAYSPMFYLEGQCLLTNNSVNVCRYGYAVGAIGALSSLALMFAACAPAVVTIPMAVFNTIWYLAFAITTTVYTDNIRDDTAIPENVKAYNDKYRTMVYALAWTCFALSLVSLPLALASKKTRAEPEKPLPGAAPVPAKVSEPAGYPVV